MSSFDDWLAPIKQRDGNFSETDKYKIFISQQTHEGLKISINLVTRGSTVFFSTQVRYLLIEKACQDLLENYFRR